MERKKIISIVSLCLIISSIILAILSIFSANSLQNERNSYLNDEDIHLEYFSVKMRDGINIKGILYVDKDLEKKDDNSVPSILMIHGINGRKERGFDKIYQFVKMKYAVFSVELRGHGESGGISSFIGKEPEDMEEVIDYIEDTYDFANATHMGLYAFSFGGGVATVLQAKDERIHASVIYHPLASIDDFLDIVPIENLLGKTPEITDIHEIEDGLEASTPKNTKNLLLIHGEIDDVIQPEDSEKLYKKVDGPKRDDIALEIRPDLGHGENEADEGSLKYTLVWFEHFFHDGSINITDLDNEIKTTKLLDCKYPNSSVSEDLLWVSAVLLAIGLGLFLLPIKIWPLSKEISDAKGEVTRDTEAYKKMIVRRSVFYIIPALIGGILFGLLNPSYMYGYFLIIPLATAIIMLFIPSSEYSDWKSEWKEWYNNDLKLFLLGIGIIIIPVLFYVLIFNFNAGLMLKSPIPFFTGTTIFYILTAYSVVFCDYLLIRRWKLKHSLLLIGLRPLSLFIFYIFVPIPPSPYTNGFMVHLIILSLIGLLLWLIILSMELGNYMYKNRLVSVAIVVLPLLVFLMHRFFRIL